MRTPKTKYKRISIRDFTGGLNTELSEFDTPDNEFKVFENFILTFDGIRLRGGFQLRYSFGKRVLSTLQRLDQIYLIFEDGEFGVYNATTNNYTTIEVLVQPTGIPKMVWFEPYVIFTLGGFLWAYHTEAGFVFEVDTPEVIDLMVKYGRVVIATGDEVWMSRVGEPMDWVPDSSDEASAQYFQIGYKEGEPITAINHFLDDILVFKESKVYQLVNMSEVRLLNSKRGAMNNSSTISLMADVYAIDRHGFYSVVRDRFIDVVAGDLDLKIKSFFRKQIDSSIRIFYSPTLRAFIIKGKDETFLFFYEYGSYATFKTLLPIEVFLDKHTLYGFGSNLYQYRPEYPYDSYSQLIHDAAYDIAYANDFIHQVEKIHGIIKTKTFMTNRINILRFGVGLKDIKGRGRFLLKVGKKVVALNLVGSSVYIYDASEYIADSYYPIYGLPANYNKHFHCNQVVDSFFAYAAFDAAVSIQQIFIDISVMEV